MGWFEQRMLIVAGGAMITSFAAGYAPFTDAI